MVTFSGTEETSCVLSGFTITKGVTTQGAGIFGNGTLATIENNRIISNTALESVWPFGLGGGLAQCHGIIRHNIISDNFAAYGGGIYWCEGTIQNNTISGNETMGGIVGGGVADSSAIIKGNIISGNSGGGLIHCHGTITNNIISANDGKYGCGLYECNGIIQNNIISGNSVSGTAGPM